jgi:hypothetical protein
MRRWMLSALAGVAVAMAVMPAQAAWKTYVNKELGLSFMAPGEVKTSLGTFRGNYAGPRQTIVYRSVENNIEYKVTVMSFIQAQAEGATILGEREYMFQDGKGKKVLADRFGRVGSGKDAVYGRAKIPIYLCCKLHHCSDIVAASVVSTKITKSLMPIISVRSKI